MANKLSIRKLKTQYNNNRKIISERLSITFIITTMLSIFGFMFTIFQYIDTQKQIARTQERMEMDSCFSTLVQFPKNDEITLGYIYFNLKKLDSYYSSTTQKYVFYQTLVKQLLYELDYSKTKDIQYAKAITEMFLDKSYADYMKSSDFTELITRKIVNNILTTNSILFELKEITADDLDNENRILLKEDKANLVDLLFIIRRYKNISDEYGKIVNIKKELDKLNSINSNVFDYFFSKGTI